MSLITKSEKHNALKIMISEMSRRESTLDPLLQVQLKVTCDYPTPCPEHAYKMIRLEQLRVIDNKARSPLDLQLMSTFQDTFQVVKRHTSLAALNVQLEFTRCSLRKELLELSSEEEPITLLQRKFFGSHSIDAPHLESSAPLSPLGFLAQKTSDSELNKTLEHMSEDELGFLRIYLTRHALLIKKGPLSLQELALVFSIAKDTSWYPSKGLCAGLSDLFNAFTLSKFMSGTLGVDSLLKEFQASDDIKKAASLQMITYFSPLDVMALEGGMIVKKPYRRLHNHLCDAAHTEYLEESYPHLEIQKPFASHKAPYLVEISNIDGVISSRLQEFGIEISDLGSPDQTQKAQALLMNLIMTSTREKLRALPTQRLAPIIPMIHQRSLLSEKVSQQEIPTSNEVAIIMASTAHSRANFGCKVSFSTASQRSGHVISCIALQDAGIFIYFDSNFGSLTFENLEKLLEFFKATHREHHHFDITFMWPNP